MNRLLFIIILTSMIISTNRGNSQDLATWPAPRGIALVYPERLPENPKEKIKKKDLLDFYNSFIHTILENATIDELTIIHRAGLKEKLLKEFDSTGDTRLNLMEVTYVQDIWIRDWAPIAVTNDTAFKALYSPQYFANNERQYAMKDDQAGIELAKNITIDSSDYTVQNIGLTLDGGNLIHNRAGIGITTNRIIADNESFSIDQIKTVLKKHLGISRLIIVPVEPGDETGHIDGMARFIDEKTVVVAAYSDDYKEGQIFLDNLASRLQKDFVVVRVTNELPKGEKTGTIPSAYGNYINYLRLGDIIFLPQYGNDLEDKDKAAILEFKKYFKVIPVRKDINKLAELGGVLNCITWSYD